MPGNSKFPKTFPGVMITGNSSFLISCFLLVVHLPPLSLPQIKLFHYHYDKVVSLSVIVNTVHCETADINFILSTLVVLEGTAAAPTFRGFLIQPRLVADDTTVVGGFVEPPIGANYGHSFCSYREVC